MAKTKDKTKDDVVEIKEGDKVCVEYADGPCTGIVSIVADGKCTIGFDDGTEDTVDIAAVKLISKAGAPNASDDVTDTSKKSSTAVSPNAQQLEEKANLNRRSKIDAANKQTANKEAATDVANAGKPLTSEEKEFMTKVEGKLNGRKYRNNDVVVTTARMTSLPSSADMTRYARLVRQKEGK